MFKLNSKALLVTILSFIFLLLASLGMIYLAFRANLTSKEKLAQAKLNSITQSITNHLESKKQFANILAGFVSYKGYITENEFENFAKYITKENHSKIISLQWAPNGIIKYLYPRKGNEKAIGLDLFSYPTTKESAIRSLKSRKPHINGPIPLIQGGTGIVYRVPVFKIDTTKLEHQNDFLGYAAVVIDWKSLVKECEIQTSNPSSIGLKFTQTVQEKQFYPKGVILGDINFFQGELFQDTLSVSDGKWILATKISYDNKEYYAIILFLTLAFLFSFIIAYFIFVNSKNHTLIKSQNELLIQNNQKIEQQVVDKVLLINEIHHRVKNNFQLVSSLARLQSYELNDPKAIEVLQEFSNRVSSLALTHDQLLLSDNHSTDTSIKNYILSLCDNLIHSTAQSKVTIKTDVLDENFPIKYVVLLGIILNELITNSLKYAFKGEENNEISISLTKQKELFELDYSDNGCGINNQLLESESSSFGLDLIKSICEQLDASIQQIQNQNQFGFKICFKL